VSLEALSGDPDLYLALNLPSTTPVSPANALYSIAGFQGSNLLSIATSDPVFRGACPTGSPCTMSLLVYGYTPSTFVLTVSTGLTSTNLTDSIPTAGSVGVGQWVYYTYIPPVGGNITIACTVTGGSPDIYISTNPNPNTQVYMWSPLQATAQVAFIPTSDPNYVPPPFGIYYIGVIGWGSINATFTLLATAVGTGPAVRPVILQDGQPQAFFSLPHMMSYFSFNMSSWYPLNQPFPGLDIFAIPQTGDVDVFISNITDAYGNVVYPVAKCLYYVITGVCSYWGADPATYTWSSMDSGVTDFISISPLALYAGQQVGIGVLATTPNGIPSGAPPAPSVFSVTASTGAVIIALQPGVPTPGIVTARLAKYYKFTLTVYGADYLVSADVQTGSMDLFAAEGAITSRPGPGNNTYNTTQGGGILRDKLLRMPWASLSNACARQIMYQGGCEMFISAVGFPLMPAGVSSSYTLAAAATGSPSTPMLLPDGISQYTVVPAYGYQYFYAFASAPPGSTLYITVNSLIGASTLFVNLGTSPSKTFWTPGSPNADYTSTDAGGYERVVITPPASVDGRPPSADAYETSDIRVSLEAEAGTGFVHVKSASQGDARVVERLGDGSAIIAVTLPSPFGDVFMVKDGSASMAVPVMSSIAAHMGVGPFASSSWAKGEVKLPDVAAVEAAAAVGGRSLQVPVHPPYCNNCELFITLRADGGSDCSAFVDYRTGSKVTVLSQDAPLYGSVSPSLGVPTQYYSFAASDPTQDIVISVDRLFGNVQVLIIVEQPTRPYVLPGSGIAVAYTWSFFPGTFTPSITISHTDPNFCAPSDGTRVGTPCNFLIAIEAAGSDSSAFTVTGSSAGSAYPVLFDGVPQAGQVIDTGLFNYVFQPVAAGYPCPASIVTWTNILGNVQAYVTNQYVPGTSAATALPGPSSTSCQWVCTNYTGCFMSPGDPCYAAAGPGGVPIVYTIAIIGASGIPTFMNTYVVTAVVQGDATRIVPGVPTTDIFVPYQTNVNFTFDLGFEAANNDLMISATVNHGAVAMMISHDDPINRTVPGCIPPHSGAQLVCSGYTWLSTGSGDAMVVYIPAANPCSPISPGSNAPIVGGACAPGGAGAAAAYRPGRYWITIYGFSGFSELSLSVTTRSSALPYTLLADGQPLATQTGPVTVCPNGSRDSNFNCNSTTVPSFVVQGSFFVLRVPSTVPVGDMYVQVDRLCGGNTTGDCGVPLFVAANGCADGTCTPGVFAPYANDSAVGRIVYDAIGGIRVPWGACYGPGAPGTADCIYSFGVFPICTPGVPNVPGTPGVGCAPSIFRVTLSTPVGIQRVAQDCLANGAVCTLPEHDALSGYTRRYESYAGSDTVSVPVTLTASLCSGDPSTFAIYVCGIGGNCGTDNTPGPPNNDVFARGNNAGVAALTVPGSLSQAFFVGILSTGKTGLTYPTFQLQLQGGSGPVLIPDPNDPYTTVYRDSTLTKLNVAWTTPLLTQPGQGFPPVTAPNMFYFVTAYPVGTTGQAQLSTPCGVRDAAMARSQGDGFLFAESVSGNFVVLSGASSTTSYSVSVVAICPGQTCMPYQQQGQSIAFPVSQSDPVPPAPSPSASPIPGLPAPAAAGSSIAGPAAGGAIGALLLGGLAFMGYRRWGGGSGGSPYVRVSSSSGANRYMVTSDDLLSSGGGSYVPAGGVSAQDAGEAYSAL